MPGIKLPENFPIVGKQSKIFSNHWKIRPIFSNHWKNIFQSLENLQVAGTSAGNGLGPPTLSPVSRFFMPCDDVTSGVDRLTESGGICRRKRKRKIELMRLASGFRMVVLGGALLAGADGCGVAGVRAEGTLTTAEVFDMLPGSCLDDLSEQAEYEMLVGQGEAIYGSLLEIVRDNTDYWVVSGALAVLKESKGDKREAIAELRQILAARASEVLSESEKRENGEAVVIESPFLPTPDGELTMFVGEKPLELERLVVMLGERIVAIDGELWPKGGGCGDGDAGKARLEEQERTVCKALLRVVKDSNWPYTVQSALALLKESNVDKAEMARQMKECLAEWLQGDSWTHEWMIPLFADALADAGGEEALEALVPLLSHPVESARFCCARHFGARGGRKELALLEEAKGRETDERILAAIERGIAEIKTRLAEEEGRSPEGDETTKGRNDEEGSGRDGQGES